jgi:predicted cupin superfamily sugar epimerase
MRSGGHPAEGIQATERESTMTTANQWIESLKLTRHPEGGYYRENYRSPEAVAKESLPARFGGDRAFSTAIYFLLQGEDFSALHRIKQDEVWHFYDGSSVTIHVLDRQGNYSTLKLGRDLSAGEVPQAVVPAGCLFGATVHDPRSFCLAGCTVAPGFDFADFELPGREELCKLYPQHQQLIERLTR